MLSQIDRLVLDPLGPLHTEPDRLLLEELPPAAELRPILDAIGLGAHRVSEIAGRIGRQVTSLARPISRLQEMGLVTREVPFGELETQSKRSLYKLSDPFFRLWFKVVAQHRARLLSSAPKERIALLRSRWPALVATAWEELCRALVVQLDEAQSGPYQPAGRYWRGNDAEWDVVCRSTDEARLLVGEAKWSAAPFTRSALERLAHTVSNKPLPALHAPDAARSITRALFVPQVDKGVPHKLSGVQIIRGSALFKH